MAFYPHIRKIIITHENCTISLILRAVTLKPGLREVMWFSQSLSPWGKVHFQARFVEGDSMTIVSTTQSPLVPRGEALYLNQSSTPSRSCPEFLWIIPKQKCALTCRLPAHHAVLCQAPTSISFPLICRFAAARSWDLPSRVCLPHLQHTKYIQDTTLFHARGDIQGAADHTYRIGLMTGAQIYIA